MSEDEIHELQGKRIIQGNTTRDRQDGDLEKSADFHRESLEQIRNGLATKVRILTYHDCCPVCRALEGAYSFESVPELPHEGCSHPQGCRCRYAPVLDRFGP